MISLDKFVASLENLHDIPDFSLASFCEEHFNDKKIRMALIKANHDLNIGSNNLKSLEKVLGPYLLQIPFLKEHLTLEYNGLIRTGIDYANSILDCSFFRFSYLDLFEIFLEILKIIEGVPFSLVDGSIITTFCNMEIPNAYAYLKPQNNGLANQYIYIERDEIFYPIKYLVREFHFKTSLEPYSYKIDWKINLDSYPYLYEFLKKLIYENYRNTSIDYRNILTKEQALQVAYEFSREYLEQKQVLARKKS